MSHKGKTEKLEKCYWFQECKNAIHAGKCESCGESKLNFKNKYKIKELLDIATEDFKSKIKTGEGMNQKVMFSSKSNEWETPQDLFDKLNDVFNFTLDPCSTDENYKCKKHYTQKNDGLTKNWANEIVFCNPPYGNSISKWVEKCYKESLNNSIIVMLIPSRTDTRWQHDYIFSKAKAICFIKGRLKFINKLIESTKPATSAPFPSQIVVFGKVNTEQIEVLKSLGKVFINR